MAVAFATPIAVAIALDTLMGVQETCEDTLEAGDPSLSVYRRDTIKLLRKYFRHSLELGRLPNLLGREFFRARVTSYRLHTFEDGVIFAHDVDRCLALLDDFSQQAIARVILQEYDQDEAAELLGCTGRTLRRRLPEALDRLTGIFIEKGML